MSYFDLVGLVCLALQRSHIDDPFVVWTLLADTYPAEADLTGFSQFIIKVMWLTLSMSTLRV